MSETPKTGQTNRNRMSTNEINEIMMNERNIENLFNEDLSYQMGLRPEPNLANFRNQRNQRNRLRTNTNPRRNRGLFMPMRFRNNHPAVRIGDGMPVVRQNRRRNQMDERRRAEMMGIPPELLEFDDPDDENIRKRLNKKKINQIPKFEYKKNGEQMKENDRHDCSICYENYNEGEFLKRLKCSHLYHSDCVDEWLTMKNECPICKKKI